MLTSHRSLSRLISCGDVGIDVRARVASSFLQLCRSKNNSGHDVNALRVRVRLAHGCWRPAPRSATVACFRFGAPPQFKVCRRPSCTFSPHIVKRDGGNHATDEASGVSALPKAWRRVPNPQLSIRQRVACCALRHLVQCGEQDFAPICWARHARGATRLEVLPPPLLLCRCCRCCRCCHR